jgi:hypothetical protein
MILTAYPHKYLDVECVNCTFTQPVHLQAFCLGAKVISLHQIDSDVLLEFSLKSVLQLIN